jgi:thioredoxin 1
MKLRLDEPTKMRLALLLAFLLAIAVFVVSLVEAGAAEERKAAAPASPTQVAKALAPGEKVTFLELGSVGCRPCDAMRPVMDAVRQKYGKQVEVTFHDVRKNPEAARQYRVYLIPTQVFLDPAGREVFRHEGFLALAKVEEVLRQLGVR